MSKCKTTHHFACDCREENVSKLLDAARWLAGAYFRLDRGTDNGTVREVAKHYMEQIRAMTTGDGYFAQQVRELDDSESGE